MTVTSSTASSRGLTIEKKPSLVFSVLSWMFTPSSVMLIDPCGRPLIVEFRLPDGVDTPGMNVTKSIALRLVSGSLTIWFVLIVLEMVDDCVWTISEVDETTTCSLRPPTSSRAFTLAGAPVVRTTLLATNVLNPCSVTVTL